MSVIEKKINHLRENLNLKQRTQFLRHTIRNLMVQLKVKGNIQEKYIKIMASKFYKISDKYLKQ